MRLLRRLKGRKILIIGFLAMTMMVFAAACGKDDAEDRDSSDRKATPTATQGAATPTEAVTPTEEATPTPTAEPTPTEEPSPTPSPTPTPAFYKSNEEILSFLEKDSAEAGADDSKVYWEIQQAGDSVTGCFIMEYTGETAKPDAELLTTLVPQELINDTIPGYLGAVTLLNGTTGLVKVGFVVTDETLWKTPDEAFCPVVYALNKETQTLYEFSTEVDGNAVSIYTTYPGTYVLINKAAYTEGIAHTGVTEVDFSLDSGADSNNDGITDFLTILICDGVIRTGTGAKIFNGYTYDQIQANDDIDGDGIKNGDEYVVKRTVEIPKEATEYNGRYYMRYDTGYIWEDVEALCESYGGHLLTITDEAERDFIIEFLKDGKKSTYWLGATDVEEEGTFRWVTGEPWEFEDWAPLEPNNDGAEDYVEIETWSHYRWNDGERDGDYGYFSKDNHGFVCEWEQEAVNVPARVWINDVRIGEDPLN